MARVSVVDNRWGIIIQVLKCVGSGGRSLTVYLLTALVMSLPPSPLKRELLRARRIGNVSALDHHPLH